MAKTKTLHSVANLAIALFVAGLYGFAFFPYGLLLAGSFLPDRLTDNGIGPSLLLSDSWTAENHYAVLSGEAFKEYGRYFVNTALVGVTTAVCVACISLFAALGVTRSRLRRLPVIEVALIIAYLFPPIAMVFPYAEILRALRLNGSLVGLILVNIGFSLPFGFWLLMRFASAVPIEFDQSASVDGANWWQAMVQVVIPRLWPGIAAVGVFSFVLSWNDVAFALILGTKATRTLAAGAKEVMMDTESMARYSSFSAISLWIALPLALGFAYIQHRADRAWAREATENH